MKTCLRPSGARSEVLRMLTSLPPYSPDHVRHLFDGTRPVFQIESELYPALSPMPVREIKTSNRSFCVMMPTRLPFSVTGTPENPLLPQHHGDFFPPYSPGEPLWGRAS